MKHEHNGQFNTVGFLLYDLLHIIGAVIILIALFLGDAKDVANNLVSEAKFVSTFTAEVSEIVLGLLLMCFVAFIIRNVDIKIERIAYTFAFVIASLALILPSLSNIVDIVTYMLGGHDAHIEFILSLLQMLLPLFAMLSFALSLFKVRANAKLWAIFLLVGMGFMLLSSVTEIIGIIVSLNNGEEFELIMIIETISLLAPFLPVIFGIKDLQKMGLVFSKKENVIQTL